MTPPVPVSKRPSWRHLEDTAARYQPCPRCGDPTLTAWSSGVKIRLDPKALERTAEILALLSGRQTFDLVTWGLPRRMYPVWRDPLRMTLPRKHHIVATHICRPGSVRPPIAMPEIEIAIPAPRKTETSPDDKPPF